ncbi:hypothetical protein GCM10009087_00900 [Sphingomonas oligophenolica]|uniref:DUF4232 domain-containing protein n=1 Tax=Sphingomonas oligophenolica TaxID=301154 RepID=A0ABU9Y177_9SPHN
MPILAILLLAEPSPPLPPCRVDQLRVSLDGRDGDFNGMSHSGTEFSIRNIGKDCMVAALPKVQLRDANNRILPALRQVPREMHPGPVMMPVRLAAGHRAAAEIRWVADPVFPRNQSVRAARISVKIGAGTLEAPLAATLYGAVGKPVTFEQTPLRAMEGMAAG